MTTFVPERADRALAAAEAALVAGQAVIVPTDTVYGLATLPAHTDVLFDLKGRPASVPIAVLVDSLEQARLLVRLSHVAERVARALWPGPLTLVLERVGGVQTLGVRCPDHAFVRALSARVGPLSVTSANRHGQLTRATADAVAASFDGVVGLAIDGGACRGVASTVVDATDDRFEILREGPISAEQIRNAALT